MLGAAQDVEDLHLLDALRADGRPLDEGEDRVRALSRALMLSPAGMTSRIDRLEAGGWVRREPDPEDRRSLRVVLTGDGRALVDQLVTEHVANEERLLSGLTGAQRAALDDALRTLLRSLEPP